MRKLEQYLKGVLGFWPIVCIVEIVWKCVDYWLNPLTYAMQSAPWYLQCIVTLAVYALIEGMIFLVFLIIRQINKKKTHPA